MNAIIVVACAASLSGVVDVEAATDAITAARVFVTQPEPPANAALRGLQIARAAGTLTVFNPAPAALPFDDVVYPLCDFITPNEHEAALLTGLPITNLAEARAAGEVFLSRSVGCALIMLGRPRRAAAQQRRLSEC